MKFIRIFLLVLIVVGLGLIVTQKMWVPGLVNSILKHEAKTAQNISNTETSVPDSGTTSSTPIPLTFDSFSPIQTSGVQTKTYTNSKYNFAFSAPADFALATPTQGPLSYSPVCDSDADQACIYYTDKPIPDGFEAATFEVEVSTYSNSTGTSSPTTLEDCENAGNDPVQTIQQKNINGITFYVTNNSGGGLGHGLELNSYHTYFNQACYVIKLNIASNNGISGKGLDPTFRTMLENKLQSILSTFSFTQKETLPAIHSRAPSAWRTIVGLNMPVSFQYSSLYNIESNDADEISVNGRDAHNTYIISVQVFLTSQPLDKIIQNAVETTYSGFTGFTSLTLGGDQAYAGSNTGDPADTDTVIYVNHEGITYRIFFATPIPAEYQMFLRSFKFTS